MPPYSADNGEPHHRTSPVGDASDGLSSRSPSAPLAVAALIVCITGFVLGLVPLLGAVLGLIGLVLVGVAARRGLATKRTYAGALAASVGVLASLAMSVALVGLVIIPNGPGAPEPTVASGETEEIDEDPETDEPQEPVADDESTSEAEPAEGEQSSAEDESEAATAETEPAEQSTPAPTATPDLSTYEELDERALAQIVKAPDDHIGRQVIVYGTITQLDAATGQCFVRVSIAHAPQDQWYDYEHNTVGLAGDGESDCPVLDPFVADDEVKLWVTVGGSISYETQIGGSTTVPAYVIDAAELQ